MPVYEYECSKCGRFEYKQRIIEDPLNECPRCGAAARRLISRNINVVFKGPGFYVTDNRSSGQKADTSTENGKNGSANGSHNGGSSKQEKKDKATSETTASASD